MIPVIVFFLGGLGVLGGKKKNNYKPPILLRRTRISTNLFWFSSAISAARRSINGDRRQFNRRVRKNWNHEDRIHFGEREEVAAVPFLDAIALGRPPRDLNLSRISGLICSPLRS